MQHALADRAQQHAASPPYPRAPTTRPSAWAEASTSVCTGCPVTTSWCSSTSGCVAVRPATVSDSSRRHSWIAACSSSTPRSGVCQTYNVRSTAPPCGDASSNARSTAAAVCGLPSTPTTKYGGRCVMCSASRRTTTGQAARAVSGRATAAEVNSSRPVLRCLDPTTTWVAWCDWSASTEAACPWAVSVVTASEGRRFSTKESAPLSRSSAGSRDASGPSACTSRKGRPRRSASSAPQASATRLPGSGSTPTTIGPGPPCSVRIVHASHQ